MHEWDRLAEPFGEDEIEWRVGQKSKRGDKATLLAYLTSRAVQDRLDRVVGPANWRDEYTPIVEGGKTVGFMCTLSIRVEDGWVSKSDISDTTDIEALKGGVSGALKRAAVKWGIGRYLYGLDSSWHEIKDGYPPRGTPAIYCPNADKAPGYIIPPRLPAKFLPPTHAPTPERQPEPERPQAPAIKATAEQAMALRKAFFAKFNDAYPQPTKGDWDDEVYGRAKAAWEENRKLVAQAFLRVESLSDDTLTALDAERVTALTSRLRAISAADFKVKADGVLGAE